MLRRFLSLAVLTALSLLLSPRPAAAAERWAVLVGIDHYQRSDVASLHYAVADARAVARTLIARAGFASDHVFLLTSDQSGDGAPTRENVAFRLGWLATRVHPGDTVVFYFSGHGIEMGHHAYLMTAEADPRNEATLSFSGLRAKRVHAMLAALPASHLLVFADACRSDPRAGKGMTANNLRERMARDLVLTDRPTPASATDAVNATFLACSPGHRSYEWTDEHHGYFTFYLTQGLDGAAADAAGRVTVESLEQFLRSKVPKATEVSLGVDQVPWIQAEGSGLSTWPLTAGGAPVAVGPGDLPSPSAAGGSHAQAGGSPAGPAPPDHPPAPAPTQSGSTVTVGHLQVTFQPRAGKGWVGSNNGYVGQTFSFVTGQTGNDIYGGADVQIQTVGEQPGLVGHLEDAGNGAPVSVPPSQTLAVTPGQMLLILDKQGYYNLVRVDRVAPSAVFFSYWKQTR